MWLFFFLACDDFGRMFDHLFPDCTLKKVKISSRTLIPLFMPGSVHSDPASWDDCGRMFPYKVRVSSFLKRFLHYARTAARSYFCVYWLFRSQLQPLLLLLLLCALGTNNNAPTYIYTATTTSIIMTITDTSDWEMSLANQRPNTDTPPSTSRRGIQVLL